MFEPEIKFFVWADLLIIFCSIIALIYHIMYESPDRIIKAIQFIIIASVIVLIFLGITYIMAED
jgi:hypothetical protein